MTDSATETASAPASISWQERCTKVLLGCLSTHSDRFAAAAAWSRESRRLAAQAEQDEVGRKVIIADCDLSQRDFRGFDFKFVYFARVEFTGCNLASATFEKAIFRQCQLTHADARDTSFKDTNFDSMTTASGMIIDDRTNLDLRGSAAELKGFDQIIRDKVEEVQRISQFKSSSPNLFLISINYLTDYGRSLSRLSVYALAVVLVFALIYWAFGQGISGVYGPYKASPLDCLLMSLFKFINTDYIITSDFRIIRSLNFIEAALGIITISLVTAVLAKKLIGLK